ncbi:uncharacterized protein [Patagioenas fasciata]|uniref:uncharacterized protein isoform X1 n=1 Tax=Patagioenas fasciata TaxID=372321 RepID=UPI003A9A469F
MRKVPSGCWAQQEPALLSSLRTFYAVSFLMVVVYVYKAYRTVHGWRAWPMAALQERSRCLESVWQGLPYILAWLVPALALLGQLVARGISVTDIAPRPVEPIVPGKGNGSNETYSLYCSSCLLLIHRAQDVCYQYVGRKDVGLEGKIIFFLYLLLVLSCCTLLYHRVKLRCRRNAGAALLSLERDGFAGRSVRSVSQVSHNFLLVFLLCWAPAFLLTLLSFTSIKPASVFVLYVATVSKSCFLGSRVGTFAPTRHVSGDWVGVPTGHCQPMLVTPDQVPPGWTWDKGTGLLVPSRSQPGSSRRFGGWCFAAQLFPLVWLSTAGGKPAPVSLCHPVHSH